MLQILFVDDDAIARRNIRSRIDWSSHGWNIMHVARDGTEALDYMKGNLPDLIISDIKMPLLDGIEMAKIAKDYYPNIKFIFLSGYKDFEYAKQAVQLSAIDYLTKPFENETLIKVIERAVQSIEKDSRINKMLDEGYPLIKRHYISKLMYDNFKDADCATFQAFDINLINGLGIVGFVDINNTHDCESAFIETEITKLCNSLTKKYLGSFFLPTESSQIFSIFTSSNLKSEKTFYEKIRILESEIQDFLNSNLSAIGTFIYGSIFDNLSNLYLSYQEAQKTKNSQINCALYDVKHYIETHYQEPHLTLVQIADYFNINHCYLTSLYKNKFGINLYDYLIQVRMEKAGEFLHTTNLKSYQIAEKVGYSNSQYFSLSFKKYFSCTTTEYKNQTVK